MTGFRTGKLRLALTFEPEIQRLDVAAAAKRFRLIERLFALGFWLDSEINPQEAVHGRPAPADMRDPTRLFNAHLEISRISYNSPFHVVLEIAPYASGALAGARGVLYLMSKWEDYRVKHASSSLDIERLDLQKQALQLVKELLPNRPEVTEGLVNGAALILSTIHKIEVDSSGSDAQ
jgi:hypothetical protein